MESYKSSQDYKAFFSELSKNDQEVFREMYQIFEDAMDDYATLYEYKNVDFVKGENGEDGRRELYSKLVTVKEGFLKLFNSFSEDKQEKVRESIMMSMEDKLDGDMFYTDEEAQAGFNIMDFEDFMFGESDAKENLNGPYFKY